VTDIMGEISAASAEQSQGVAQVGEAVTQMDQATQQNAALVEESAPPPLSRLSFIRRCRDFGFSIDQVRELVALVDEPDRPCAEVREIAALHLTQVRDKLEQLKALEASLGTIVRGCDSACAGGPAVDCTILEELALRATGAESARTAGCCGTSS
jgi:hypothetical protein